MEHIINLVGNTSLRRRRRMRSTKNTVHLANSAKNEDDSRMILNEIEAEQFKAQTNEEIANATPYMQLGKEQIKTPKEALNQSIERQKLGTAKPFEVFHAQQFFLYPNWIICKP
jgi:hypothetical protein